MDTTPHPAAGRTAKPLRCTSLARGACIAFVTLAWPVLALADCVDTRKATAGEIEFHKRATATLLAALPPVPVAGKLQQKDSVMSLGQQCGPTGDFTVQASRGYEHNGRLAIVAMSINVQQLPAAASALSAAYGTASPGRSTGLKVHNVVWTVSGSDSPLRKTLAESIGRAHLQALVGRPLPTVAESEALAAQAVPATVTATAAAPSANAPALQATGQPAAAPDPSMPAARQPGAAEPVRDAADAVNKLRGLFGR